MKSYLEFRCRDCGEVTEVLGGSARCVSGLCADCFEKPVLVAAKTLRHPAADIVWKIVDKKSKGRVKWFIRYSDPVRRAAILARVRKNKAYDPIRARAYYLANRDAKLTYGRERLALRRLLGL